MKAEKARGIADDYNKHNQYRLIEKSIGEAATKGLFEIMWLKLTDHTKIMLKEDGYKIEDNGESELTGKSYRIKWNYDDRI